MVESKNVTFGTTENVLFSNTLNLSSTTDGDLEPCGSGLYIENQATRKSRRTRLRMHKALHVVIQYPIKFKTGTHHCQHFRLVNVNNNPRNETIWSMIYDLKAREGVPYQKKSFVPAMNKIMSGCPALMMSIVLLPSHSTVSPLCPSWLPHRNCDPT